MRKRGKKAQIQISFGMIFSIILIVAFIAVAIYAIIMFLDTIKCANTGLFKEDLQNEVNRAWSSQETLSAFTGKLPGNLNYVCFIDLSKQSKGTNKDFYDELKKYGYVNVNMFFYPIKKACNEMRAFDIKHLNIAEITKQNNPYCVRNVNGKASLNIEKGFYDALVCIDCSVGGSGGIGGGSSNSIGGNVEFCGFSTLASCNSNSDCKAGGCSSQVCESKNQNTITTCEWKDCYDNERYNLQCNCVAGKCKWD